MFRFLILFILFTVLGCADLQEQTAFRGAATTGACTDALGSHAHGAVWECPDGCNTCTCVNGQIRSTQEYCE